MVNLYEIDRLLRASLNLVVVGLRVKEVYDKICEIKEDILVDVILLVLRAAPEDYEDFEYYADQLQVKK
jgi:hypothetical protein